ncbi:MAG: pentapeptide repeat-containing protein [Phormidesmis sp. CAN_BIN36]|nr:pentapeptide repeat-containing protein [Phormidesmis sp. CAN_BIN36]
MLTVWKVPQWQADLMQPSDYRERFGFENTSRDILLKTIQTFGISGFVFTAYLGWQSLKVAQSKEVTDRYSKAVEQVGNNEIHVRIGGIYALERIANDSRRDYQQVMEVLTAYLREISPYPLKNEEQENRERLPTDIEAVLRVLKRRKYVAIETHLTLELTDLRGANLGGANLQNAWLDQMSLQGASLLEANLQSVKLQNVDLSNASLQDIDLREGLIVRSNFERASLPNADFRGARLIGVNFRNANLCGANFRNANLHGIELEGADLTEADFREINSEEDYDIQAVLDQIKMASNWKNAFYDADVCQKLGLSSPKDNAAG